jgi:hypothetical protein
LCL